MEPQVASGVPEDQEPLLTSTTKPFPSSNTRHCFFFPLLSQKCYRPKSRKTRTESKIRPCPHLKQTKHVRRSIDKWALGSASDAIMRWGRKDYWNHTESKEKQRHIMLTLVFTMFSCMSAYSTTQMSLKNYLKTDEDSVDQERFLGIKLWKPPNGVLLPYESIVLLCFVHIYAMSPFGHLYCQSPEQARDYVIFNIKALLHCSQNTVEIM